MPDPSHTVSEQTGEIVSVNVSEQTGTIKTSVPQVEVNNNGVAGDAHAGDWHRQISMLSLELIEQFSAAHDRPVKPGEFAENITTRGIDLAAVAVLDRVVIGNVELQVTQIGKKCHGESCAIFREVGACVMPREGLFTRVRQGGTLRPGDTVRHVPRPLTIRIVTLSDRASRGDYDDLSGPRTQESLATFFGRERWHTEFQRVVIPDDPDQLRQQLSDARDRNTDVLFTTGGTGVGPRDITPEVAAEFIDKTIPGVMDMIRIKYGTDKPNALLSRSVAGVMGNTLVYTLPGSVKAVTEYVAEIVKTIEHLILTIHGVDTHG